jgi:hypothetical protein
MLPQSTVFRGQKYFLAEFEGKFYSNPSVPASVEPVDSGNACAEEEWCWEVIPRRRSTCMEVRVCNKVG